MSKKPVAKKTTMPAPVVATKGKTSTTAKTTIKKTTVATNSKTPQKSNNLTIPQKAENKIGTDKGQTQTQTQVPVKIEMDEATKKRHNSAITIQKYWRRHGAKHIINSMKKEKEEYENKIKTLEHEAFLQMIKQEQEKEERKREKMMKEKQEKLRQEKRRKKFLEVAFDGNVEELKFIINEFTQELNSRSELDASQKKSLIFKLIDSKDPNNNTALSEASASGNVEIIRFLLSKSADPNSIGAYNRTPLWRSAFASHLEASQILLENGADPRLYTSDGQRPIDVATNESVKKLLENWNITLTERMLQQIKLATEANIKEQLKSLDAICLSAEKEYENSKKDFEQIKTRLFNCNQELNRLHDEYLLNEKMYGDLIEIKEAEKVDLKIKFENARENMVKKRIKYRETLFDSNKEKKMLKKDLTKNVEALSDYDDEDDDNEAVTRMNIKEIDDMILRDLSGLISKSDKWPLIIDQNDQACTFLRYRDCNYINCFDTKNMQMDRFRLALIGSIRYGKPFVLDLMEYD